jgi:hypothetical protein
MKNFQKFHKILKNKIFVPFIIFFRTNYNLEHHRLHDWPRIGGGRYCQARGKNGVRCVLRSSPKGDFGHWKLVRRWKLWNVRQGLLSPLFVHVAQRTNFRDGWGAGFLFYKFMQILTKIKVKKIF